LIQNYNAQQYLRIQSIPQRKKYFSITKINWLILFKARIPVYYENHMEPIIQNVLLILKAGAAYSYHWVSKG
jgi:hypothetical protein